MFGFSFGFGYATVIKKLIMTSQVGGLEELFSDSFNLIEFFLDSKKNQRKVQRRV